MASSTPGLPLSLSSQMTVTWLCSTLMTSVASCPPSPLLETTKPRHKEVRRLAQKHILNGYGARRESRPDPTSSSQGLIMRQAWPHLSSTKATFLCSRQTGPAPARDAVTQSPASQMGGQTSDAPEAWRRDSWVPLSSGTRTQHP